MPDTDPASSALSEIRAIEQAATPGEWKPRTVEAHGDWTMGSKTRPVVRVEADAMPSGIGILSTRADAEFIAMARTAMPRLVAAVEAALKPHRPGRVKILGRLCERHENHRCFSITSTEADDVRSCPDCAATVYTSCAGCGPQVSMDACRVREAITAALTGETVGR